ncbi:MAG: type VI secretion system protein TssA [Planctomycetaceae bacterium]
MIDFELLMKPITPEQPCGADLGQGLRDLEPEVGVAIDNAKKNNDPAQWIDAVNKCERVLGNRSKDLRLVSDIIRGRTVVHGFEGLRDGLMLASNYLTDYWDHIHPRPDEDGYENTLRFLIQLDSEGFTTRINLCPLFESPAQGTYRLWDYLEASSSNGPPGLMEQIQAALAEMSDEKLLDRYQVILEIKKILETIRSTVFDKTGAMLLTFTKVESSIDEAINALMHLARARLEPKQPAADEAASESQSGNGESSAPKSAGSLRTREDAFAALLKVAEFFERTEPQSVLPAQIRRIVEWGKLSPDKLYSELIEDKSVRDKMFRLVGIRAPE